MSNPNKSILAGEFLIAALAVTEQAVKVLIPGQAAPEKIHPARALDLVRRGRYEGGGNHRRCRWIREVNPDPARPPLVFQVCWRNSGASVLLPPIGYAERMRSSNGQ